MKVINMISAVGDYVTGTRPLVVTTLVSAGVQAAVGCLVLENLSAKHGQREPEKAQQVSQCQELIKGWKEPQSRGSALITTCNKG